jgi:hypothetical protein
VPTAWLLAHELTHVAQKDKSVDTDGLLQQIKDLLTKEELGSILSELEENYPEAEWDNEITAHLMGEAVTGENIFGLQDLSNSGKISKILTEAFDAFPVMKPETLKSGPDSELARLASSPSPESTAVAQALAKMPAKYREVFAAVTAGKTPAQVAKQFGVTEKAVFNIANQVRARIAIATKAEQGTLTPRMQGDQFERGRPDLAEGGQAPFVAVDQIRNELAPTPVVGMEENHAAARQRLAADYEGEFTRLETMARDGMLPTAVDIAIAKQIFKRETLSGGLEDPARRTKVALFRVAYRDDFGTEQGRALQMRRDEAMPPAERNALHLAELLYEPSPDVQARIKAAKGNKGLQDAILKQWMDKIDAFHAEMKADGYDIKASMAKFQREKEAREAQEQVVKQQHDRLANAYQADVDALQQQLAFTNNATFDGVSSATDYTRKVLAEVKAAQADGWSGTVYKAGKFGSLRIFVKGDKVLTNAGAEALVSGKFEKPEMLEDRKGWQGLASQQAEFAAKLTDWLTTLPDSTLDSASAFGAKVSTTKIGEWFEIERTGSRVMLWLVNPDAKVRGDIGRRTVAISGTDLPDALKKVIAYAANKRDGVTPETAVGFHSYETFPGVNDAATVGEALRAAGFKAAEPGTPEFKQLPPEEKREIVIAKTEEKQAERDAAQAASEMPPITNLESLNTLDDRLRKGTITAEQMKAAWEQFKTNEDAIRAETAKLTIKDLSRYSMRKPDNKDDAVRMAMSYYQSRFNPTGSLRLGIIGNREQMKAAERKAMDENVAQWTDEKIQADAQERRDAQAARQKALENPETKDEWEKFVNRKGVTGLTSEELAKLKAIKSDYARHDAIMARGESRLTPEQLAAYDDVRGIDRKAEMQAKAERNATVRGVKADTTSEIVETQHTKTGVPLFVVKLADRVERDVYTALNTAAKRLGGYYSSYRGGGAVPGFQFKDMATAEQFQAITQGETVDRTEAVQERQAEKKNAAAERLAATADRMDAAADESLGRDRKDNTHKRATEAAYAEANARGVKAMAETMRNLANAIESGEATHLDGVRTKTHVETLQSLSNRAKDEAERNEDLSYTEREKRKGENPTPEQIDKAKYPWPFMNSTALQWLRDNGNNTPGAKRLVARLDKVFEAKPSVKENGGYLAGDSVISLVKDLLAKINKQDYTRKNIEDAFNHYDRLQVMGLKDLPTLRAALREFLQYRGTKGKADPLKAMERDLVGKNIPGFFPTPQPIIEDMLDAAGDLTGKHVLEPSGGKGDIADAAKAAGAIVDVAETHSSLRDILEARGHYLAGRDFMDMDPTPRGFTYGDVFQNADNTKGIMRGQGGMGSDRVRLMREDGTEIGKYNRSELEGVEKRGAASGYDVVLMNPPFEDGQDGDHVRRAYEFLKPGGKVVAITGEGIFGRSDKKSQAFRDWLESVEGTSEKLPEGSFKSAFRPTGVNTRMVVIDKPAALFSSPSQFSIGKPSEVFNDSLKDAANAYEYTDSARTNARDEESLASVAKHFNGVTPRANHSEALRAVTRDFEENSGLEVRSFTLATRASEFKGNAAFVIPERPGTIWVNSDSGHVPIRNLIAHEWMHSLSFDPAQAQLKDKFDADIAVYLDSDLVEVYKDQLLGRYEADEIHAEMLGDLFADAVNPSPFFKTHELATDWPAIQKLAADLWQNANPLAPTGLKEASDDELLGSKTKPRFSRDQPDLFTAATAPDATEKLGQVKVGSMNALGAYRALTAKRDAGKTLTGKEEQQLLDAETALGQKLAFDMDALKGTAPAEGAGSATTQKPAAQGQKSTQQSMFMGPETPRTGR